MRVLVACEFSGMVRNEFLARGHDAWSCDLDPCWEEPKDRHIVGDVRPILQKRWDIVIAHPPCTYLCRAGQSWMNKDSNRYGHMLRAVLFFLECYNSNSNRICVENPRMMKPAMDKLEISSSQIIQPWMFGEGETKETHLWLKGLPNLEPTDIVNGREQRLHKLPPSRMRSKYRSITYIGIARAMAEQWGSL